jgi:hypothetical protein
MIAKQTAIARAEAKGATWKEIAAEADRQDRHVGTAAARNMIRALNLHPYSNTREEWVRLAGALIARDRKRNAA